MQDDKKHADFQNNYRRSSNFQKVVPEKEFEVEGDGELKLFEDNDNNSKLDKDKIADAMDKFQERIEQTPGGEQTDDQR